MAELTEAAVEEIAQRVEEARAGQLSLYGLFGLLEDLEPVPGQLERARRRRDEGGQLSGPLRAVLDQEDLLGKAVPEMKRTLAEDLERALQAEGITVRERQRALAFVETQLKAAAKDNSQTGATRRSKLKEKRTQLETSQTVGESREVLRLEKALQVQEKEFKTARETYEMWQAGRVKFSSNSELQATKRRYETLNKQVTTAEAELEAALRRRRPPGAATEASSGGAWAPPALTPAPKPKATASTNGKAPTTTPASAKPRPVATASVAATQRAAVVAAAAASVAAVEEGESEATVTSFPQAQQLKAKPTPADLDAQDGGWQRRVRVAPDTKEVEKKREAQREAKNAAKRRGQELMAGLAAEMRGEPELSAPGRGGEAGGYPADRGGPAPVAHQPEPRQQQRPGWQAVPPQVWAELQANRPTSAAPVPTAQARMQAEEEEEVEEEEGEEEGTLAEGWEAVWSEEHGMHYYWNTQTDEVQWEPPLRPQRPNRPPPPPVPEEVFQPAASSSVGPDPGASGQGKKKKKGKGPEQNARAEEVQRPSASEQQEAARRRATSEAIAKARRSARGEAAGFWDDTPSPELGWCNDEEDTGPRLSFECVCTAVAAELGVTTAQVRGFGVSSVSEWRANFSPEEWSRIRDRAVALENAKKSLAQKSERDRTARHLARIAESHGAPAAASTPKAATGRGGGGAASAASAVSGRGRGAGGSTPGPGPPQQQQQPKRAAGKKKPEKPPASDLGAMAHRNRFANIGGSSDSDDD